MQETVIKFGDTEIKKQKFHQHNKFQFSPTNFNKKYRY